MKIWLEEQHFRLYGRELEDAAGIEFFEILNFNCVEAVEAIIGDDFFGDYYDENTDGIIEGWESEEEMRLKMLEWDISLAEEIVSEQKTIVLEKLLKAKEKLYFRVSKLKEYGVQFSYIEEVDLLAQLVDEL